MGKLRIATWNVNSVRKRLGQLGRLAVEAQPDVVCLQETKCRNAEFPSNDIKAMGFGHVLMNGQKGYHGVAVVSKLPLVALEVRDFNGTRDARHIGVTVRPGKDAGNEIDLHNFYVPAGGEEPDPEANRKFHDKLVYLDAMAAWGKALRNGDARRTLVVGDLNVAPLEHDVWSHEALMKVVSHTPVEVECFEKIIADGGWHDVMRRFTPAEEKLFTWWSYRSRDWRAANKGRRLDHVWANDALAGAITSMSVMTDTRDWPEPSDHVPVLVDIML